MVDNLQGIGGLFSSLCRYSWFKVFARVFKNANVQRCAAEMYNQKLALLFPLIEAEGEERSLRCLNKFDLLSEACSSTHLNSLISLTNIIVCRYGDDDILYFTRCYLPLKAATILGGKFDFFKQGQRYYTCTNRWFCGVDHIDLPWAALKHYKAFVFLDYRWNCITFLNWCAEFDQRWVREIA